MQAVLLLGSSLKRSKATKCSKTVIHFVFLLTTLCSWGAQVKLLSNEPPDDVEAFDDNVIQLYRQKFRTTVGAAVFKDVSPLSLHYSMFIPTLEGQANDEQKKYWLKRAINLEIVGTYAQVSDLGQSI